MLKTKKFVRLKNPTTVVAHDAPRGTRSAHFVRYHTGAVKCSHRSRFLFPPVRVPLYLIIRIKKALQVIAVFIALDGAPRGTRTPGQLIRSQRLYPAELWAQYKINSVL